MIDRTLFILEEEGEILMVQVYVDDIIFGFTNLALVDRFKDLMSSEFEMSMIGEFSFFLASNHSKGGWHLDLSLEVP